jgi:hypothetical protein
MREELIATLYNADDQLKQDELRRLQPGTQEFAILDATLRLVRRAVPLNPLFQSLNPAYLADARLDNGESPDQRLSALGAGPLHSLQSFLGLPARLQSSIWEDDGAIEDLVRNYIEARGTALNNPAPLPSNWEAAAPTPDYWESRLQRSLALGKVRPSLWEVTDPMRPQQVRIDDIPRYRL